MLGFRPSSGRCAHWRHQTDGHPPVLIIARPPAVSQCSAFEQSCRRSRKCRHRCRPVTPRRSAVRWLCRCAGTVAGDIAARRFALNILVRSQKFTPAKFREAHLSRSTAPHHPGSVSPAAALAGIWRRADGIPFGHRARELPGSREWFRAPIGARIPGVSGAAGGGIVSAGTGTPHAAALAQIQAVAQCDLVITDIPYGERIRWLGNAPDVDPLPSLARSLCEVPPSHAVIVLVTEARKISLGAAALARVRVGMRAASIGRAGQMRQTL